MSMWDGVGTLLSGDLRGAVLETHEGRNITGASLVGSELDVSVEKLEVVVGGSCRSHVEGVLRDVVVCLWTVKLGSSVWKEGYGMVDGISRGERSWKWREAGRFI